MLGFFPTPFEDECFYSLCARYAEIVNYPCREKAIIDLFNKRGLSIAVDLPSSLNIFIKKLGNQYRISAKTIIENHSLFPYYAPFLPNNRVKDLISEMRSNTGETVHKISGITASSINKPNKLRFCPSCALEETSNNDILYWHRLHQLPGVFVCPTHLCFLEESETNLTKNSYKANLFCPQNYIYLATPRKLDLSNNNHKVLLSISQDSEWLLKTNVKSLGYEKLEYIYIELLKSHNFVTPTKRLDLSSIRKKFRETYEPDLLDLLQCNFDDNKDYQWISRIIPHLRMQKVHHPLRHILLIRMLGCSTENFFSYSFQKIKSLRSESQPSFIKGPYPCLNPVCVDYKRLKIKSYEIKMAYKTEKQTLYVTCHCGFAYYRNGCDSKKEDLYRRDIVFNFGELWEKELTKLWDDNNLSISKISDLLGVGSNTIKRRALALGLKFPRKGPDNSIVTTNSKIQKQIRNNYLASKNKEKLRAEKSEKYRKKWLLIRKENPNLIRSKLEQIEPAISSWLRAYDYKWFYLNQPKAWTRTESARQINWEIRDKECANKVRQIAKIIRAREGKPIWVRPGSIAQEFNNRDWITNSKYLKKMPLTQKAIKEETESRIDYNIRRVYWAVNNIKEDGSSYAFSSIGLRAVVSWKLWKVPRIKKAIEDGIEEIKQHRGLL